MRLRRSFSLDFVNDDTSTVFLGEGNDHDNNHPTAHHGHVSIHASSIHSSGTTSAPGVSSTSSSLNTTHSTSHASNDSSKGLSPFSIHSGPTITLHSSSPHSSGSVLTSNLVAPWHENPDIEDALAADFDGSLSGLGMEVGSSPYNMSDALMALPTLKGEHFAGGLHRHHHHHSSSHYRDSSHHHHIPSYNPSHEGTHHVSPTIIQEQDARPVAIVHGKKNRLPFGHDDEVPISSGIKRVCISNDRDSSPSNEASNSSRFSALHISGHNNGHNSSHSIIASQDSHDHGSHRIHSRDSSLDSTTDNGCSLQDCDHSSLSKCSKHSGSAPDLRVGQLSRRNHGVTGNQGSLGGNNSHQHNNHSTESSPSPSVLSQMLSTHSLNHHNLVHHGSNSPIHHETKNEHFIASSNRRHNQSEVSFQYTLGAATSAATKIHEETMTYLNQGQSYEIKLRKISHTMSSSLESNSGRNYKRVRTIIRVGFHERRLQFMESELMDQWRDQRHSERILEVDIPLSYGITEVLNDPIDINKCSFVWDTSKETGIFIKVNCISTEFTPKKHGGEKGVPFRVIIETHAFTPVSGQTLLHAASSQVKVFKPKGADRKHKTDREKLSKKGHIDQMDKYRPSFEQTIFTEVPLDMFYSTSSFDRRSNTPVSGKRSAADSPAAAIVSPERKFSSTSSTSNTGDTPLDFTNSHSRSIMRNLTSSIATASLSAEDVKSSLSSSLNRRVTVSPNSPPASTNHGSNTSYPMLIPIPSESSSNICTTGGIIQLRPESSPSEATQFLLLNRFDKYLKAFANFSGSDLLRLTRADLTQICDESDGIRLYNCLHHHPRRHPRCTIYVSLASASDPEDDFSAIYLESLTEKELRSKLGNMLSTSSNYSQGQSSPSVKGNNNVSNSISRIRMKGPQGIMISVTDEFVQNMQSESMYLLDFEKGKFHRHKLYGKNSPRTQKYLYIC